MLRGRALGERNGDGLGFFGPITLAGDLKVTVETSTSFETLIGEADGSFGLVKEGGETLLLYGPNTFTGPTVINAGIIRYQGGVASMAGTGANITVNRGGVAERRRRQTYRLARESTRRPKACSPATPAASTRTTWTSRTTRT